MKTVIIIFFILFLIVFISCSNTDNRPRHETRIEKEINSNGDQEYTEKAFSYYGITTPLDCDMAGDTRNSYCLGEIDSNSLNLIKQKFNLKKLNKNEKEEYYESYSTFSEILNSLQPFNEIKRTIIYENEKWRTRNPESLIRAFCIYQKTENLFNICILNERYETTKADNSP